MHHSRGPTVSGKQYAFRFSFAQTESILPPGCCQAMTEHVRATKDGPFLPNMSLLSWETVLRISPSIVSEQFYNLSLLISSSSFPLHSHRCHAHGTLWGLFPPGMSPPSLTLVGIYHINLICLITSWYLLLRCCEQEVLLLRMVQEKEQRSIRDWLTCCLAAMENLILRKIWKKKVVTQLLNISLVIT